MTAAAGWRVSAFYAPLVGGVPAAGDRRFVGEAQGTGALPTGDLLGMR